jgi:hypothetical protein
MRRLGAIIATVVGATLLWSSISRYIPATVEYRGQLIKLTRFYLTYDGYKNDRDNIDPSENARVAQLVESAPVGRSFHSRLDMGKAVFAVQFPGYGASSFAVPPPAGGTVLAAFSIEVPRAGRERVFVFEGRGDHYTLLDDFIADGALPISKAAVLGDKVVFSSMDGTVLLERSLPERTQ